MDQKLYAKAELKLDSSLQKDHNFLPALVQMAILMYRSMRYDEALQLAKHALSINTEDGEANYYYGLINLQLNNITDAKDGFDIASFIACDAQRCIYTISHYLFKRKNNGKALTICSKGNDQ
jgi:tetratricopeptide (TPR) repeat protein